MHACESPQRYMWLTKTAEAVKNSRSETILADRRTGLPAMPSRRTYKPEWDGKNPRNDLIYWWKGRGSALDPAYVCGSISTRRSQKRAGTGARFGPFLSSRERGRGCGVHLHKVAVGGTIRPGAEGAVTRHTLPRCWVAGSTATRLAQPLSQR
jgi:hypothetical protein